MASPILRTAAIVALSLSVAGCMSNLRNQPRSVNAAPSAPVRAAQLPPPATQPIPEDEAPVAEEPLDGATETEVAVAEVPQASSTVAVGRTDLLGGWALSSGGETCQLFMSLTTWTGGYRASTRGCNSPDLANISAWELNDNTVTLKGGDGAETVATLTAQEQTRFAGATTTGSGITVSR